MDIDLTITISVILALAAIISPVIVALINNRYQVKLKQFDSYEMSKKQALENFSQKTGEHIATNNGYSLEAFLGSLYSLIPYFKISKNDINLITSSLDNLSDFKDNVNNLIIQLSEQILPKRKSLIMRIFRKWLQL